MSERMRLTGRDVFGLMCATRCPRPDCDGVLERSTYKADDALVCEDCGTPAVREWGGR